MRPTYAPEDLPGPLHPLLPARTIENSQIVDSRDVTRFWSGIPSKPGTENSNAFLETCFLR